MKNEIAIIWYNDVLKPWREEDKRKNHEFSYMIWDRLGVHKNKELLHMMENDGWRIIFIPDKFKTFSPLDNPLFHEIKHVYRKSPVRERSIFEHKVSKWIAAAEERIGRRSKIRGRLAKSFVDCKLIGHALGPVLPAPERLTQVELVQINGANARMVVAWPGTGAAQGNSRQSPFGVGGHLHSAALFTGEEEEAYLEAHVAQGMNLIPLTAALNRVVKGYSRKRGMQTGSRVGAHRFNV